MREGLERARWPGRFEVVPGSPEIVLDGAHNDASARCLADTLEAYAPRRLLHVVVGLNRDKEARAILRPLLRRASSVWCTGSAHPRALDAAALGRLCRPLAFGPVHVLPSLAAALDAARAASDRAGLVCVTGSLALVGEARDLLGLPAVEALWSASETDQLAG